MNSASPTTKTRRRASAATTALFASLAAGMALALLMLPGCGSSGDTTGDPPTTGTGVVNVR